MAIADPFACSISLPNDQDPVKLRKEIQAAVEEQADIQVTDIKLIDDKYYHKAGFIHTTVSLRPCSIHCLLLLRCLNVFRISLAFRVPCLIAVGPLNVVGLPSVSVAFAFFPSKSGVFADKHDMVLTFSLIHSPRKMRRNSATPTSL
jgi:hypothetical protein